MKDHASFEKLVEGLEKKATLPITKVNQQVFSIEQLGEMVPGIVMLQDYYNQSLTYINSWGCNNLNKTLEELQNMGKAYFEEHLHPEDVETNLPKLVELLNKNDDKEIISFFLRVRKTPEDEWKWFFHTAKLFKEADQKAPSGEVVLIATPVESLTSGTSRIKEILDESGVMKKYYNQFASLTKREKEIIGMIAAGEGSRDISEKLFISFSTVLQHRKNIRKKTGLKNMPELVKFAQAFNLIKV